MHLNRNEIAILVASTIIVVIIMVFSMIQDWKTVRPPLRVVVLNDLHVNSFYDPNLDESSFCQGFDP